MTQDLIVTQEVIEAEIVGENLLARLDENKPQKRNGIDIRVNADGSKTYYILIRHNGKLIREKIGKDTEGVNLPYCKKIRADRISKLLHGELAPSEIKKNKRKNSISFDSMAQEYLAAIADLSDGKTTAGRYNNHLKPVFGNKNLDEITVAEVEAFKKKKLASVSMKTGRQYSAKSVNDYLNLINTIFRYAADKHGLVLISPARGKSKKNRGASGVERIKTNNARERYLDEDEIKLLYTALDAREGRNGVTNDLKLVVALGLCTGARLSSLLNIRKKDINFAHGSVTITDFKNDSVYTGFLGDRAIELLKDYMPTLKATEYIIGGGLKPKDRTGISKALQPILDELFNEGLEVDDARNRVVIHTLRHTFGSLLAINGTPIFTIKKLMNHRSIEMTMRYAKLAPDQGRDHVKGLNV